MTTEAAICDCLKEARRPSPVKPGDAGSTRALSQFMLPREGEAMTPVARCLAIDDRQRKVLEGGVGELTCDVMAGVRRRHGLPVDRMFQANDIVGRYAECREFGMGSL